MQRIAEHKREKDNQHLSQSVAALYRISHFEDTREPQ